MAFDEIQLEDVKKTGTTEPTIPGAMDAEVTSQQATPEPTPDIEVSNETPPAETKTETPQAEKTETPKVETFDFKAKTDGKFESFDDLWNDYQSAINKEPEQPKSLKDEYIQGLVDYYEKTGDIKPYVDAMSKNYDEMSAEQILRENMRENYPKLSDAQFEKLFQKEITNKYNINSDEFEEEEVELGRALLENDAEKIRNDFKERQAKFAAPEAQPQEDPQKAYEEWKSVVSDNDYVKSFSKEPKFTIKYDDREFNLDVKDAADVIDAAYNDQKIFSNFVEGEGKNSKVNFEKFLKTYHYAKDPVAFEKKLIEFGRTLGQNKVLDDLQNPTKVDNVNKPNRAEVTGDWKEEFFQAAKQSLKK